MRVRTLTWGCGRVCVSLTLLAGAPASAATIAVAAGGDLQAALNAAQPGDVITLAAGATYTGNFILPNKGAITAPITVRSSASDTLLPPAGVRITPAYASLLPKIKSSNSMSALLTAAAANHWTLMFLEFQANVNGYGDLIALGAGDSTQTTLAQVPYALVLDRVYVHGDPVMGQKRGIALHSSDTTIINSYIAECKAVGQDSQAISGFNGPGNYLIENNYLEGSTENFLLGGADPTIPNLVTANVTFRHNYLSKPLSWRDAIIATPVNLAAVAAARSGSLPAGTYFYKVAARMPSGQGTTATSTPSLEVSATLAAGGTGSITLSWTPVAGATDYLVYGRGSGAENMYWKTTNPFLAETGAAGTSGTPPSVTKWAVKNLFELKNAEDVVVEGNVFENLWIAAQPGFPIVFTPRNQGGTAPWVVVQRITFTNNLVRHTAGGVNVLGTDNLAPSQMTNHITVQDNIFDDMTAATWGSGSRPFQIGDGGDSITIDHNTVITTNSAILWLYGGSATAPTPATNVAYTNNMSLHNSYGIDGSNFSPGLGSIDAYLPAGVVRANVLAGGQASNYPAGNFFPTASAWQAGFVNYASGNYALAPTSPYRNAGTDEADLGADVATTSAETAIALSGNLSGGAAPCVFSVSPLSLSIVTNGGAGTATVTTPSGCAWQAASNATWLTVKSGTAGSGMGTVTYTVAANTTSSSRSGTLTIAGKTVTVTEAAAATPPAPAQLRIVGQ